tara:strand:+ start:5109 stop:6137 length:1029 start_codon:yes stop_codon:yes gene_type:complete
VRFLFLPHLEFDLFQNITKNEFTTKIEFIFIITENLQTNETKKMSEHILKTGASSILLGGKYYDGYITPKANKLLKVTKRHKQHDEFKYLSTVCTISNYDKYYIIPDSDSVKIMPTDTFYQHLITLVTEDEKKIFGGQLECHFITFGGNKDLLDTLRDLFTNQETSIWKSWNDILQFTQKIMSGLGFLHEKKLCHLDIKCENIVVNEKTKDFKIIDFGFCSMEPFTDYISNIRGTPGYFPNSFKQKVPCEWQPQIYANDMKLVNYKLPMARDMNLVYKIDSFCLGRVIYMMYYVFNEMYFPYCFCLRKNKKTKDKIYKIYKDLTNNDVWTRITIRDGLTKYF